MLLVCNEYCALYYCEIDIYSWNLTIHSTALVKVWTKRPNCSLFLCEIIRFFTNPCITNTVFILLGREEVFMLKNSSFHYIYIYQALSPPRDVHIFFSEMQLPYLTVSDHAMKRTFTLFFWAK